MAVRVEGKSGKGMRTRKEVSGRGRRFSSFAVRGTTGDVVSLEDFGLSRFLTMQVGGDQTVEIVRR